jgi:hypothetical protein
MTELAVVVRGSLPDCMSAANAWEGRVAGSGLLVRMFGEAYGGIADSRVRLEARRAAVLIAVELEGRRLRDGELRPGLDGLDVPCDPRTGKPMEVAETTAGLEIRRIVDDKEDWPVITLRRR